jgi:hypothetical protein
VNDTACLIRRGERPSGYPRVSAFICGSILVFLGGLGG